MPKPRALIATAVQLEYDSVLAHLENIRTEMIGGHPYTVGDFLIGGTNWEVLVLQTGAGNSEAAAATSKALALWNPLVAIFSGIAGGLKDVQKGDLCIGTAIHLYESGKALGGVKFLARPKSHVPSSSLLALAQSYIVKTNWRKRIKTAAPDDKQAVAYGHVVAGEKVLADMDSNTVKFLQKNYSHALAVEMEGYGFLTAVYHHEPVKGIVVRCISDCLGDKKDGNDQYQPIAAGYASAFSFEILAHQSDPNESVPLLPVLPPDAPTSPDVGPINFSPLGINPSQPETEIVLDALQTDIEAARQLIREGRLGLAETMLAHLKIQAAKDFPDGLPTIAALTARCHLYQGHLKQARDEFEEVLASGSADAITWATAAQVSCFLNDAPEALRLAGKARELDSKNGLAASIYLYALHLSKRQDLIDSALAKEPWLQENSECLFVLAGNEFERQNFPLAEQLIDKAIEKGLNIPQALVLKAQIIFKSVQSAVVPDVPLFGIIPSPQKERLENAEALLSRAIEQLRTQDFKDELIKGYLTRSGIRSMLHDNDGCLSDCTEVLLLAPDQRLGLVNMSLALMNKGAYASAVKYLERAQSYFGARIGGQLGLAYLKSNQLEKALEVFQPLYDASGGQSSELGSLLIETQSRLGNQQAIDEIVKNQPKNPDIYYAIALQLKREGRFEEAKSQLHDAIEFATGERKRWMIEELANIHNLLSEFKNAADLYKSIAPQDEDTPETRQLVVALANSEQLDDALRLAAMLRHKSGPIPVISEIEASILADTKNDLRAARDVLQALVEVEPNRQWHYLNIAKMSIYLNEPTPARQALAGLTRKELTEDMLSALAELETNLKRMENK